MEFEGVGEHFPKEALFGLSLTDENKFKTYSWQS